jgi:hypothetical protein
MSFTAITIAGQGINVTIARPVPSPLTVDYQGLLPVAPGFFGINSAGGGYFDAAGATPGEQAALGFDVNANRPTLTRCSSPATVGVDEDQAARFRTRADSIALAVHLRHEPAPRRDRQVTP